MTKLDSDDIKALKILGATIFLIILVPLEIYTWVKFIHPFYWSPGIAYTEFAWTIYLVGLVYLMMPFGIIGYIRDKCRELGDD